MSGKAECILDRKFPSFICVVSDNITAQLFNEIFSKDLVVFCPDFQNEQDFPETEFASKKYVPIENTIIDSFSIKLLDENNNLIQLLPSHASSLNMDLHSRFYYKKTRQVHLTSALSTDANIGSLTLKNGRCVSNFNFPNLLFIASTCLLKILGYNGLYNEKSNFTKIVLINIVDETKKKEMLKTGIIKLVDKLNNNQYTFENRPDLNNLKPGYLLFIVLILKANQLLGEQ
jgi:hypothetical protein